MGNIRLSYSDADLNGAIDPSTEIIEESNYYPFGLKQKGYNEDISPNGNGLAQQWKFGGKEYNEELGLNWYDITARNYDPALGRWMNLDLLAENYFTLSSYTYVANNPILLTDPDGKIIEFSFTYDDEGMISSVNINVTGKVIDNTKRGLSSKRMNSARNKIVDGIKNIQVTGEGIDINFSSNIEIANLEEDIASDDHVYRLVDDVSAIDGSNHTNFNTKAIGFAPIGENVMYLDKEFFSSRTAAHETGHSAGLYHIDETNEKNLFPAAYDFYRYMATEGHKASRGLFKTRTMNMALSRGYTGDDFHGNLMHQSSTRNSNGQSVSGYLITRDQLNSVLYKFNNGQINKGRQK